MNSFVIVQCVNDVTNYKFQSGYREGITDGRNSIYQQSFDSGYEDGFRIGFALGKTHAEKSSMGNCAICSDSSLLQKSEEEVRGINRKRFNDGASKS